MEMVEADERQGPKLKSSAAPRITLSNVDGENDDGIDDNTKETLDFID